MSRGSFPATAHPAEGGWSISETKGAKAVLNKLKKDGVPNKAVDAHFNETKTQARKRKH
jgi:hypothetical protein